MTSLTYHDQHICLPENLIEELIMVDPTCLETFEANIIVKPYKLK
jgi:hypothetical protein